MRIAFTSDCYWPRVNGVAVSVQQFHQQLNQAGHEVQLWVPAYSSDYCSDTEAVRVSRLAAWQPFISPEDRLVKRSERQRFFRELADFAPDIIHCHTEFTLAGLAAEFAQSRNIPLVMSSHTYFESYMEHFFPHFPGPLSRLICRMIIRRLFCKADALVTPTGIMKSVLAGYGIKEEIHVVSTGIDGSRFFPLKRGQALAESGLLERFPGLRGRRLLLSVGRICREKNIGLLVEALALLGPEHADTALVLVGDGPGRACIQQHANSLGLEDRIVFTGYVEHSALRAHYALADLFVCASLTETQGLVPLEAMACGIPVVAVAAMGVQEILRDGEGCRLVDNSANAFAATLAKLLGDPAGRAELGQKALGASQRWTAEAKAAEMQGVYHRMLEKKKYRPAKSPTKSPVLKPNLEEASCSRK